jgi:Ser/Thr protein kinase RdoA (MazF antagonist)
MINVQLLVEVCRKFGIKHIEAISFLPSTFNRNWKIKSDSQVYILKQKLISNIQEMHHETIVTQLLSNIDGIVIAPVLHTELDQLTTICWKGYSYAMFGYIEGKQPTNRLNDLSLLATALATMHKGSSNVLFIAKYKELHLKLWSVSNWANSAAKRFLSNGHIHSKHCPLTINLNKSLETLSAAQYKGRLPISAIHWDYHSGNMVITENKQVAIFDHEYTHPDVRVADLANSIILNTCLDIANINYDDPASFIQSCKINYKKFEVFIRSYCRVSPITKSELVLFPEFLQVAWSGWCLYTFIAIPKTIEKISHANYFSQWVEKNKKNIVQLLLSIT